MTRTRAFVLAALAFLTLPLASARADFFVGVGRPGPYYRHSHYRPYSGYRVYYAPPPVYVVPRAVYVAPAPATVYVQPAPTYLQTVPAAPPRVVPVPAVPIPPPGY
jgi:hypothetical protein